MQQIYLFSIKVESENTVKCEIKAATKAYIFREAAKRMICSFWMTYVGICIHKTLTLGAQM